MTLARGSGFRTPEVVTNDDIYNNPYIHFQPSFSSHVSITCHCSGVPDPLKGYTLRVTASSLQVAPGITAKVTVEVIPNDESFLSQGGVRGSEETDSFNDGLQPPSTGDSTASRHSTRGLQVIDDYVEITTERSIFTIPVYGAIKL